MITLGIPSKGRLMEATSELFAKAGHAISRSGTERGYRGHLQNLDGIDVAFLSASEIASNLKSGKIDLGVTGEDLLRETIAPTDGTVEVLARLNFGPANVVVAVPQCWLDVATMADLDDVAEQFYQAHGQRIRVATKYRNLTRRFFSEKGVAGYRIVESAGATEGAAAAGTAELIVDITTTGVTLAANQLKVLDDGLVLESTAVLAGRTEAKSDASVMRLVQAVQKTL